MTKTFKANKIACSGCANMIKSSLEDTFGEIQVNLDITPKEVTVEISNNDEETKFKVEMKELGFEIIED